MPLIDQRENLFPCGEWSGFFVEGRPERGWMHLYLAFNDGEIKGEGTDYVGPWHIRGKYDDQAGQCEWVKQYLGKHCVIYRGSNQGQGIVGTWSIGEYLNGTFHIWPKGHGGLDEMYLEQEMPREQAF